MLAKNKENNLNNFSTFLLNNNWKKIHKVNYFLFFSILVVCFTNFIGITYASEKTTVDLKKGEQIAKGVCSGCHAVDGNSAIPTFPILAGQHSAYIEKQLHNFQIKPGDKNAKRENAVMLGLATTLNDLDILNVANYYSKQKIKPSYAKKIELALIGEKLYKGGNIAQGIPACTSCHGPRGLGVPDQYPRLGGQYAEYTKTTLLAYKNQTRANNSQMMSISSRLNEKQINALSEYLAGLR
jgi:cytochrome c553